MSERTLSQKKEEPKPDEKICFIISPIGKKGSPEYTHWLKVRKHIIDKVAIKKGYKTIRSDDVSEPGKITTQIIDLLRNSDLVVADLSRENANVFYELAIRDAVRKPVILIGESDLDIPFDVRDLRLLVYSLDLDEIEGSKTELAKYIDAIEAPTFRVTSPVTMALMTPADDISASSQDYFKLILEKLSSLSANTARSQAPRALPRGVVMARQLQSLGVDVIDRDPSSLRQFEGVGGIAADYFSFIKMVQVNILNGISLVNYDPVFQIYWLWEYEKESIWYYYDESLDVSRAAGPITYITSTRRR